ncbi:hypothetical protein HUJ04_012118 [Dendroctonus ponderosae]|nr:hypothetical protein HUJ04_012118 [Dendroctonus ponderosae]
MARGKVSRNPDWEKFGSPKAIPWGIATSVIGLPYCLLKNNVNFPDSFNVIFLVITYLVPILSMTYTYARIGIELWGSQSIGECTQRQMDNIKSKRRKLLLDAIEVQKLLIELLGGIYSYNLGEVWHCPSHPVALRCNATDKNTHSLHWE